MRSKSKPKNEAELEHQFSSEQQKDNLTQSKHNKSLFECKDYISMKGSNILAKNRKQKQKTKIKKHDMTVHAHLQPDIQQQNQEEKNTNLDVAGLLRQYSKENYKKYIEQIKENVQVQMPYTQPNHQLIEAISMQDKNICVYGIGSKILYLRHMVNKYLGDHNIFEVNGYKNTINYKKVYNYFGKFLKQIGVVQRLTKITLSDQYKQYKKIMTKEYSEQRPIVVLFHCLDAVHFLDEQFQLSLSNLFSLPHIKIICSIDSLKIASIWHPKVKTNYSFRFIQIDTHVPNIYEQIFRPNPRDLIDQQDRAIMNIYQSLNNNQKRILKLLAKRQLQVKEDKQQKTKRYTLDTLLEQCIENIILSNDNQLRENLLELIDHKVVVSVEEKDSFSNRKCYQLKCNAIMLEKIFRAKIEQ